MNDVTIIMYCTTGRIHVQGKFTRDCGVTEFDAILNMLNGNANFATIAKFEDAILNSVTKSGKLQVSGKESEKPQICSTSTPVVKLNITPTKERSFSEVKGSYSRRSGKRVCPF